MRRLTAWPYATTAYDQVACCLLALSFGMLATYANIAIRGERMQAKKAVWGGDSSQARDYVVEHYLIPALKAGARRFNVRVGEVHKGLGFRNRVPLVCNALTSKKFLADNSLRIVQRSAP